MYIKKIEIENIRSITKFSWELRDDDPKPGWHVLIGDNGSGKSSLLRAISLGLIGPIEAYRLNLKWDEWLREGETSGYIRQFITYDKQIDRYSGKQRPFEGDIEIELNFNLDKASQSVLFDNFVSQDTDKDTEKLRDRANNYIWGRNKGWFSAAFGPFRRFSGSDTYLQSILATNERVAAHVSVFHESVALSNYRDWLSNLNQKAITRPRSKEGLYAKKLITAVQEFVNQDNFLPHQLKFEMIKIGKISPEIVFEDGNGKKVPVEQLGDGYRSILSLTFELIRQMEYSYEFEEIFYDDNYTKIKATGVVLIDEIDAHLHPNWQRTIGNWFVEHFPNIQFIVTTHSPLICQAALHGTIWRLSSPGSPNLSYRVDKNNPDTSEEWKRLIYGNILEAYSTNLFGDDIDRSDEAQRKFEQLASLSLKEKHSQLTPDEELLIDELTDELPATPYKYS